MAENKTPTKKFDGVIDLSVLRRKKFTIDNDENRVLELDTSDLNIITRLSESYTKLGELASSITTLTDDVEAVEDTVQSDLNTMRSKLVDIDTQMREMLDYIFDSNVSEMCAPTGSMYDPIGGQLRYEHIISVLIDLYSDELSKEMKRVTNRMKSHTAKYTKK